MKQTETHKKETHIHCQYAGSRFITLKENPGVYPCIKIFSYGLSTHLRVLLLAVVLLQNEHTSLAKNGENLISTQPRISAHLE